MPAELLPRRKGRGRMRHTDNLLTSFSFRGSLPIDNHPAERLAIARVDAQLLVRLTTLPGPQVRGTGGTLNLMMRGMRPGRPARVIA
jgi:hypothetical protein